MNTPVVFFFGGWSPILRVVFITVSSYLSLIVFLRLTGARTIANLDPFDFIITVGIGSAFGRVLTAREVALTEAVTAFLVLIGLQVLFSWLRSRHPRLVRTLAPHPALLYFRGRFQRETMARERVAEVDLQAAVREHGLDSLDEVEAVILESNGRLAVIPARKAGDGSVLADFV